jgi:hypothetical protein
MPAKIKTLWEFGRVRQSSLGGAKHPVEPCTVEQGREQNTRVFIQKTDLTALRLSINKVWLLVYFVTILVTTLLAVVGYSRPYSAHQSSLLPKEIKISQGRLIVIGGIVFKVEY